MEIKKIHWTGLGLALVLLIVSIFFYGTGLFFAIVGMSIMIGVLPFVISIIAETRLAYEKEEMFLEFARNLVESVKAGSPISKSIVNARDKPYGVLSGNIKKLANQISLGIPLSDALQVFARDINSSVISKAMTLIGQAEQMGGDIEGILESVVEAVTVSDRLKKERKSAISTLVIQGYLIFFIFIIIILVMQFQIIPMVSGISEQGLVLNLGSGPSGIQEGDISDAFLYLLLIQGLFSGLMIGKLSEGNIKSGIRHSFVLMFSSFLISVGANVFFGK